MDLSIIILNYNSGNMLAECLSAACHSAAGLDFEVYAVDNASSDGSFQAARYSIGSLSNIRWIENKENIGFARGNNPAIRLSHGRWIALINPDTLVQGDALARLVQLVDSLPQAGIAGGKLLYPDGGFQWACRRKIPTPSTALARLTGKPVHYNYPDDPDQEMEVEAVSGSFMLIRRKTLEQVGLLDESFFMYGEDLDYCLRTRQAGWQILYQPAAVAVHAKGESSRRGNLKALYEFYRAMWVFYRKHYAVQKNGLLNSAVLGGIIILGAGRIMTYPFRADKRVGSRHS
jgi:GT2 family glycosyltransferase